MNCAKRKTIASVAGIAASAKTSGSRNASVPKTKTRIASAIGMAMKNSPTLRSSAKTGSRSYVIAAAPVT